MDTLKCGHCQSIILLGSISGLPPVEWGHCHACDSVVCEKCYGRILADGCQFFMRAIERAEEQYVRRDRHY